MSPNSAHGGLSRDAWIQWGVATSIAAIVGIFTFMSYLSANYMTKSEVAEYSKFREDSINELRKAADRLSDRVEKLSDNVDLLLTQRK